tara:strand:+ start:4449 stop:5300 length:852 start_codon:yes stop_codon:yes gene_type:complete
MNSYVKKMTFNISLIQLNGKVNSSKNAIISVLTDKWPLSAREIYTETEKRFDLNISYQAIHKTIKQLEDDRILANDKNQYKLNSDWIEKAREFSEQLSDSYKTGANGNNLTLPSLYETDKFLMNVLLQNLPKKGEKPFLGLHWCHFWIPLFLSVKEYNIIKENIPKFSLYALARGNTKIDEWCANFWSDYGVKKKLGVDCAAIADLVIFNDTIIEVFYPADIKRELDRFYEKAKSIEDLNVNHLFENIFNKQTKINIAIHKNKELADQLKEQTLNYFNDARKC